jgi:hypothetical protein
MRKQGSRGSVWGLSPEDPRNPVHSWLFDADEIDRRSDTSSTAVSLWLELDSPAPSASLRDPPDLADRYRDQLEMRTAEAFAEREARLVAEREIVVRERDEARRSLDRIERTFEALTSAMFDQT